MSHRPIEQKQRIRVAKGIRRAELPKRFDLVEWLIRNKHAVTKRGARVLIYSGRVQANSHPITTPLAPVELRSGLVVTSEAE